MSNLKQQNKRTPREEPAALRPCSFCRQVTAREVLRPQLFERAKQWLVIEQVPTMVCGNCHETYFTGGTLEELERILEHQAELATLRPVPVARYSHTAA